MSNCYVILRTNSYRYRKTRAHQGLSGRHVHDSLRAGGRRRQRRFIGRPHPKNPHAPGADQRIAPKDRGVLWAGEGTTPTLAFHLHHYCKLNVAAFYRLVEPQWKLGIRFEWGPRPFFNYVFGFEFDTQYGLLPRGTGYYINDTQAFEATGTQSGLMNANNVWLRQPDGWPRIVPEEFGYHVENDRLIDYLETLVQERAIPIIDDEATEVTRDQNGVTGVHTLAHGTLTADLYIDATGMPSRLLGDALKEPFLSYEDALFCDRAVVGGWARSDEPIKPYTTAQTMTAGWSWQVEHERRINRGYIYSSRFLSEADAEAEFLSRNPKVEDARTMAFRSGRHERYWVQNVVGIGAAAAFVEPLEASELSSTCVQAQMLAEALADCELRPNPTTMFNYNRLHARAMDSLRDFLAIHYRFNTRLDTPFWRECRAKVALHGAEDMVAYFQANGPSVVARRCLFEQTGLTEYGMEGYLALLVGLSVPYHHPYVPSEQDQRNWERIQQSVRNKVASAYTVPEALALVRSPRWAWPERLYNRPQNDRP